MTTFVEAIQQAVKNAEEERISTACDAYCKVCGHFPHTVPTHICRQDCRYYQDFKQLLIDNK